MSQHPKLTLLNLITRCTQYAKPASVLVSCLCGLTILTPSYASERIRWTPDPERGSVGSTLSGGRRGQESVSCRPDASDEATQLTLLVPGNQSGLLTTQTTPPLAWHVSTVAPVSVTFHFSDPTLATPIYTQTVTLDHTATVSVTLPKENHLESEKRYRWTVFVSCPHDTQTEISARSFIELVDGESLDVLDVDHLSHLEQASAYASQGIWYNAIAALLAARNQGVTDAETMVQSLLEQSQNEADVSLSVVVNISGG
ncbi:DUF928 domain-containing protein [Leptolyngbya cf. ectocarpi LEGE 11479]|uniref:DUF928 domain-containing protein n=1 Tax=Leptolyngbya cf. ectocarpi LEGE 11479 TaxID=1828722 RepID=A0A928ZTW8_LEPEC|nr:DUF928 domain-containing protein [Leptolyngbya ectocarpi]MBE9067382.1 DUF928 domain-containing protein [Leptolyngbya cf. ectocarpi LEGE 11479]